MADCCVGSAFTAAVTAHGRSSLWTGLDAEWLAAARTGHARAVLAGRPLLSSRLESATRRCRQHGPAGGARDFGRLWPVGLPSVQARRTRHAASLLRGVDGGHHAGA